MSKASVTHFNGGGNSVKDIHGSVGVRQDFSTNGGKTTVHVDVERHGQIFGKNNDTVGRVGIEHNTGKGYSVYGEVSRGTRSGTNGEIGIKIPY